MRVGRRASVLAASALLVAAVVGIASTMPSVLVAVALASTTALIMGGTGHPLSTAADTVSYVKQYMGMAIDNFVAPSSTASTGIPQGPYNSVAVITPEEHAPNYGTLTLRESVAEGLAALDSCVSSSTCDYNPDVGSAAPSPADSFVVFGYSQSAAIAMLEKARLADEYAEGEGPDVSFVLIGAARPNGGLVARDTTGIVTALLLGVGRDELIIDPAPTDTQYSTVDIALQYDGFADFPLNPLNLLASLNAYMGIISLHSTYGEHSLEEPGVLDQGQYGDTHYYSISTDILPLLKPLESVPMIGRAWADSWDPVLRVIVESAYDRSVSPGEPTPFNVFYSEGLIRLAANILAAIPIGMDNGIETLFGVRPLGTERPGAYGVGGSDIDSATTISEIISTATATPMPEVTGTRADSTSDSGRSSDATPLDAAPSPADVAVDDASTTDADTDADTSNATSGSEFSGDTAAETSEPSDESATTEPDASSTTSTTSTVGSGSEGDSASGTDSATGSSESEPSSTTTGE